MCMNKKCLVPGDSFVSECVIMGCDFIIKAFGGTLKRKVWNLLFGFVENLLGISIGWGKWNF